MLKLSRISKTYKTGDFTQTALDGVSIAFRRNEFVAILGASGSGKTTLLNIIGGLDTYDQGELQIEGRSTREYRDRDWDAYRNNRIGFVFQSYNLIPHQSVLTNVELALTLSGVGRSERRRRAAAALERVGLAEHRDKRPNQLSGGQMQRVAIARALINDPEILLADEPTGALDSETAAQIMALLTEIAADRLVIMVTHNPDLAEKYATRTVNLRDGRVIGDTDPYRPEIETADTAGPVRRTKMSFLTAIALSFSNLMTKKGRTAMTAFAGSIGIIGIAAILALANGVNTYIRGVEEDTLSVYPISIQGQGFDMTALLAASTEIAEDATEGEDTAAGSDEVREIQLLNRLFSAIGSNDLAAFKTHLDSTDDISEHANTINYSYDVTPQIFNSDTEQIRQVNPDTILSRLGLGPPPESRNLMPAFMSASIFSELLADTSLITEQYDVVAGHWPQAHDEMLVVLTPSGGISDFVLYTMGLKDPAELERMVERVESGEPVEAPQETHSFSHQEILDVRFKVVPAFEFYEFDAGHEVWLDKRGDEDYLRERVDAADDLKISGIVQPRPGVTASALNPGIYYPHTLTTDLIDAAGESEIVRQQLDQQETDVFTGRPFMSDTDMKDDELDLSEFITVNEDAIADAFTFDESQISLDFSGFQIGMPQVNFDPGRLPELDLEEVFGDLADQTLDSEAAEQIPDTLGDLLQAYFAFAEEEGLDFLDVSENLPIFLETEEGQERAEELAVLTEEIQDGATATLETAVTAYLQEAFEIYAADVSAQVGAALEAQVGAAIQSALDQFIAQMPNALGVDEEALLDAFESNVDLDELSQLLIAMSLDESSISRNLRQLGYADLAEPAVIDIYPKSFEDKEEIIAALDTYNDRMQKKGDEERVITYTDFVGTLMSSVTDILNVITYVLIAFVSISLVVSSIMIGVITYVSVLERIKEIGILRAIGAAKRDVRRVFNAETLIIGFIAGVLGIGATILLTLPANALISARFDIEKVAQLPAVAAIILVSISMLLTFIAGLLPAGSAARKDPVAALRSE